LVFGLDDLGALLVAFATGKLDAFLVHGGRMAERHMVAVEHVLDLELPVAVEAVAMLPEVEGELAVRRAVDEVVDVALHRADLVLEARAMWREARKHEAAVDLDARHARKTEVLLAKSGGAPLRNRDRRERAVRLEQPAVVEAGHAHGVAA